MARSRRLEVVIAGDAKGALTSMSAVDRRAGGLGRSFAGLGTAAAVGFAAVGVAAVGAGAALYGIGSSFDDAYDKIRVRTGQTGEALGGLQNSFRNVVRTVPADFGAASDAIAGINQRLGLTGQPLEAVSRRMLELSRLTETDLNTNIQNLTRVFGDWGVEAADMPGTMDMVFRATQQSGVGLDQLSAQVVQFGAPLRNLGFSFEDSVAMLSQFEAQGVNTTTVMSGMRQGLKNFAADGEAPAEAFGRFVDGVKNGTLNMTDAMETFGARAGADMFAAISEGRFDFDALSESISNGSDTIMDASRDTRDFGEQWQMIKNRVMLALEPVATRVFTAVGDAMTKLGPIVGRVADWLTENIPPAFERVKAIAEDVWPKVRDAFLGAVSAISGWWNENGPAIMGTLRDLQDTFSSAFDAIRLVVDRVLGVITNLWDRFGGQWLNHLQTAFSAITEAFRGALQAIKGVLDVFVGVFTGDWGRAWDGVKGIFSGVWHAMKGIARALINGISGVIGAGMAVISAAWGYAWRGIQAVFRGIWNALKSNVRTNIQAIKSILSAAWNAIKATTSRVWNGIKGAVTGALDGIKSGLRTAKSAMSEIWNGIKNMFRSPVSAVLRVVVNPFLGFLDRVAGVVGLDVPHDFDLPAFHTGGVVPGRGEMAALLLGGEGVLNPEAMRELGPKGFAALNRGRGVGDGIGQAAGTILGPTGLGQSLTQGVLDEVLGGMRSLIGKINDTIPGDWLRKPLRVTAKPLQGILDFVAREGPKKLIQSVTGDGMIWEKLWGIVSSHFPGAQLFSSFRPGAITATGNQSLHARGRAIDISPDMGIFNWLAANYPGSGELIFSPAGNRQIYKGAPHFYGEPTRGDHWDHIHWGMFDRGGWLKPGLTMAYNGTGRPERVVGPGGGELVMLEVTVNINGNTLGTPEAVAAAVEEGVRKGIPTPHLRRMVKQWSR